MGSRMTLDEMHTRCYDPDQSITPGYELVTVTFRNGKTLRGFARGEPISNCNCRTSRDPSFAPSPATCSLTDEKRSLMKPLDAPDTVRNLSAYLSRLTGIEPGPLKEALKSALPQARTSRSSESRIPCQVIGPLTTAN